MESEVFQAVVRRELFPDAPDKVKCKLCGNMMPNPVIEYGVFTVWCMPCVRSKFSKRTLRRMAKAKETRQGKSLTDGAEKPRPVLERMGSKSPENGSSDGKPQLTLLSYLIHG